MDDPLQLSVIIPHLNEPDDLRRCLLSLNAQHADGIPFEIIVVDNGSTEMPAAACSHIQNLRLEREILPGPGPARNLGASLARAEILAFIDSDCIAQPGWVRAVVGYMARNPDIDLIGGEIGVLLDNPACPSAIESYENIYSYRARVYVERYGFAATGNMAVRARVFQSVGPFGGIATMEDTEWGQRATSLGYRIAFLPEARVLTPSCKSFAELARRWDRHVAHEYGKVAGRRKAMLRWFVGCAIVVASPLAESIKIMRTDRVSGMRNRLLAMVCLTRIRLHRGRRMFDLALRGGSSRFVENWNRERS
ncbi:glycosyltransferase [Rhizobium giardinii]|uniref:Glycosyltransferase involved in cell wall biosynthesis n=1 Tax=Rhizobium giardinii TaxID=56731 RepID=A0A7W8UEJ3_9HYPH|nr:glycosyltransferase family A protein [Rhizobium giardinii]MBB5537925.1 glycosyltransferase involved in cell wall biosynthesis [Rhizobium giardinii]